MGSRDPMSKIKVAYYNKDSRVTQRPGVMNNDLTGTNYTVLYIKKLNKNLSE